MKIILPRDFSVYNSSMLPLKSFSLFNIVEDKSRASFLQVVVQERR
jgi:hypothetical protein